MDYVGFEKTVLNREHSLLVIGKENDLEELVRDTKNINKTWSTQSP